MNCNARRLNHYLLVSTLYADEYQRAFASRPFNERIKIALDSVNTLYSENEMFNYAVEATLSEAIITTQSDNDEEQAIIHPVGRRMVEKLVSVHGFEAIGEYSRVDIEHLFKQCDTDDSGYTEKSLHT